VLADTISTLAAIDRAPCSPGEREAAEWLRDRLAAEGADARIEEELAFASYAPTMAALGALSAAGSLVGMRHRLLGALLALKGAALIADDCTNGMRPARRLLQRRQPTTNVVGVAGDPDAARTLVVLSHHDAAPTGLIFDQTGQRAFSERFPQVIDRIDTSPPLWWPTLLGGLLGAAGAARRSRRLSLAGTFFGALTALSFADIARSPHVPGANDNLTGCAVLVGLAAALRERPVAGLRVLLVSAGAEETLQGGIHGFAARHFGGLPRERTWFLVVDTVGAPHLAMLEGEGPMRMHDYPAPEVRDLVAATADDAGIPLRRGLRARTSTDAVIPANAGYPTATLVSIDHTKAIPNYHLMTDTPENVELHTVQRALALSEAVARRLASA
jgi:hypothetical protein